MGLKVQSKPQSPRFDGITNYTKFFLFVFQVHKLEVMVEDQILSFRRS